MPVDRVVARQLAAIEEARAGVAALAAREQELTADLRIAQAARIRLAGSGAAAPAIAEAEAQAKTLVARRDEVRASRLRAADDLRRARDVLVEQKTPDQLVASLAGTHPIAMLPVRLETRFFNSGNELRVRIFPDQIHLRQHDPALTADESAAAAWYWSRRAAAGGAAAAATREWDELVRRFGGWRAAWIVEAGRPGAPVPPARAARWSRTSTAAALPDRWLIVGYSGGKEQFRKWGKAVPDEIAVGLTPDPAADPAAAAGPDPTDLPLPAELKWIADYATAEATGMAVTITQADVAAGGSPLASGVERLVAIGVDWTLTPAQGASALGDLLEGHLYSDGLAVVPQGTPTNNTASAPAPAAASVPDPSVLEAAAAASTSMSRALGLLLGVADTPALRRIPGGTSTEVATAGHLLGALWSGTLGYYLSKMLDPLISAATVAAVREHAVTYLRPSGVVPVFRVGRQPYGILPVLPASRKSAAAADGYDPGSPFEANLFDTLAKMRAPWSLVTNWVPRVITGAQPNDTAGTIETRMKRILEQAPVATALRYRRVLSVSTAANSGLPNEVKDVQQRLFELLQAHFGWNKRPYVAGLTLENDHYPLPAPFVQAAAPGPLPLAPNYLAEMALLLTQPTGRDQLGQRLTQIEHSGTLLAALVALGAIQTIDAAVLNVVIPHLEIDPTIKAAVEKGYFPTGETINVAEATTARRGTVVASSPHDVAHVILPSVDARLTVSELVAIGATSATVSRKLPAGALDALRALIADLDYLKSRNADEIDWAFRGVLDCFSYRLDAWMTSLANRRLADVRARPASASGTYIGGYGWVEDLKPESSPASQGYVFAPSLAHAATAAILRSGYISQGSEPQSALAVDLSSERVARALQVLEGVSRGQPLAALLGYRLERGLRTRSPLLARFILPLRKVAPLRPARAGTAAPAGPSESLSARDVCDGVALLDRLRSDRAGLLSAIATAATPAPAAAAEIAALMPQVAAELGVLAELMDAVSDVLIAEGVYQTVLGNPDRAGAALAVLDHQIRPLEPQVVETPRTGHRYTQRVGIVTGEMLPAADDQPIVDPILLAWAPLAGDARSKAEPRVNAWIARILGSPERYRFAGDLVTKSEARREERTPLNPIGLAALGLSPLGLMAAAKAGSQGQPSELQQRIVHALVANVGATPSEDTTIELSPRAPEAEAAAIGLAALESILGLLGDLLGSARSLDARDFALATDPTTAAVRVTDVRTRADALIKKFRTLAEPLHLARLEKPPRPAAVRAALLDLSDAGFPGAFPAVLAPAAGAFTPQASLRLLDQARDVDTAASGALARIDALDAAWAGRGAMPDSAEVEHHVARIRELLGKDFLLVSPFDPGRADHLAASLNDQQALNAGDPLAAAGWLPRLGLVRPPLDRLARVTTAAELLRNLPADAGLRVMQLPHAPGARWLALPQGGRRPAADLAIVLQSFTPLAFDGQPLAGFFCDEWNESIPNAAETVAATFHYNAPGARPPQAIVVAAPPSLTQASWSTEAVLAAANEALSLAKLRMIGPAQLDFHGLLLPTTYLPDGFTVDVPGISFSSMREALAKDLGVVELVTGKNTVWKSS